MLNTLESVSPPKRFRGLDGNQPHVSDAFVCSEINRVPDQVSGDAVTPAGRINGKVMQIQPVGFGGTVWHGFIRQARQDEAVPLKQRQGHQVACNMTLAFSYPARLG
ncbi:MAG TPA: hypothetical protein VFM48_12695, partial [Aquabacterium sp.]|nr:hypothetical protein [Aquabacterium sp.]